MAVEVERKFVLPEPPGWLDDCRSVEIEQGYVSVGADGTEVRARRIGPRARLTVKSGEGLARRETEIELGPEQFDALWPLTEGQRISKRRHYVEAEAGTFEVDVYRGKLEGLVTAEIEFDSEASSQVFQPPQWLGREVTGDGRYANASLALHGIPQEEEQP